LCLQIFTAEAPIESSQANLLKKRASVVRKAAFFEFSGFLGLPDDGPAGYSVTLLCRYTIEYQALSMRFWRKKCQFHRFGYCASILDREILSAAICRIADSRNIDRKIASFACKRIGRLCAWGDGLVFSLLLLGTFRIPERSAECFAIGLIKILR
jgi:hypothetical protein